MTTVDTTSASVMDQLKASTADLHHAAESHPFQRALVSGQITTDLYARYLGQMLLVHERLESLLKVERQHNLAFQRVIKDYQFQTPYLRADLAKFGVDVRGLAATPATGELIAVIERLASTDAMSLLGMHYVLEGSNNGNRFIARALMKSLGLTPGPGLMYLDPYGESQRGYWQAFKDDMNAVGFDQPAIGRLIAAAGEMFRGIGSISQDVWSTR